MMGRDAMSIERQIAFWLGAAALLGLFLWALSGVMLPFAAGLTLAYLLDPTATRLQKLGMSRLVASPFDRRAWRHCDFHGADRFGADVDRSIGAIP
jgi:predicted PurR-regulated permease PerM